MSEIESSSQEQEVNIVEKFREILDEVPRKYVFLECVRCGNDPFKFKENPVGGCEDSVFVLCGETKVIPLQVSERNWRSPGQVSRPSRRRDIFRKFPGYTTPLLDKFYTEKTTAQQLMEIVESNGIPTSILYMQKYWDCLPKDKKPTKKTFVGVFPFSEISEDLGLE